MGGEGQQKYDQKDLTAIRGWWRRCESGKTPDDEKSRIKGQEQVTVDKARNSADERGETQVTGQGGGVNTAANGSNREGRLDGQLRKQEPKAERTKGLEGKQAVKNEPRNARTDAGYRRQTAAAKRSREKGGAAAHQVGGLWGGGGGGCRTCNSLNRAGGKKNI